MKYLYIVILLSISAIQVGAQGLFVEQAKITYDKKKRLPNQIDPKSLSDADASFANLGNTTWTLVFDGKSSLYKSFPVNDEMSAFRELVYPNLKDEFYFNFQDKKKIRKTMVNKESFLLEDSIPALEWKLLPETREIAGFECRKALTRINDTVYVVAFYTDKILLKGGPEGFNGLPGMILGLAIPRFLTTWFASKVEIDAFDPNTLQIPKGGKNR